MRQGGRGRIRVRRDEALLLREELSMIRHRTVIRRADAKDSGAGTEEFQHRINIINKIEDEVERTIEEMGWLEAESS